MAILEAFAPLILQILAFVLTVTFCALTIALVYLTYISTMTISDMYSSWVLNMYNFGSGLIGIMFV